MDIQRRFIRSFVCVKPPRDVGEAISSWIAGLGCFGNYRWVSREQIHITLRFLGEAEPSLAQKMDTALSFIGGLDEFDVALAGSGGFPNMSRPRALWLAVADGAGDLSKLASRVEQAARSSGFAPNPQSGRKFNAHLTIARARSDAPPLEDLVRELKSAPSFSWRCRSFLLMKSTLTPEGAIHTPLREYPLG
ncbi:MAG: RNA 2',3'-cyclic phosphodiesterase [Synergistaceae bacterium]|nr:RNA 2',3'-cyclic phosphodiesterase [Synergistaceae bacterium]